MNSKENAHAGGKSFPWIKDHTYAHENMSYNWATLLFNYLEFKFVQECYHAWCLNTNVAKGCVLILSAGFCTRKADLSLSFDTIHYLYKTYISFPLWTRAILHTASSGGFPVCNRATLKIEACPFFPVCCRTWILVFIWEKSSLLKFPPIFWKSADSS